MRALGLICLIVYLGVVLVTTTAAARRESDPPHVGTNITREPGPSSEEAAIETLRTKVAELRRIARARARTIRNQRAMLARRFAYDPGHWLEQAFLCIHRGEGSWTDRGAPYWGGLQMDGSFQQTYGGAFWRELGTADQWPPSVQIAVAIRAWFTRGFHPWPNTARACGLL